MRQEVAVAWAVLLLTGSLSDLLVVAGRFKTMGRPGPVPKPKKGLSNKAKIAAAGAAGVAGGMVLGSVLSGGRYQSQWRNGQQQMINGTLGTGSVVSPLGSLGLMSSMLILTHCAAVY